MDIDRGILKRALCGMRESSKFLLLALVVSNFLTAVKPFIVLYFSAAVVDGLYNKAGGGQVLLWAFEMLLCVFCVEVAGHLIACYVEKSKQAFSYHENLKLTEKNMQMDFQTFESSCVQDLLEGIRKAKFQRGDSFSILIQSMEEILVGFFGTLTSLIYVLQFFKEKYAAGVRAFETGAAIGSFLILVAAATILTIKNSERHNKKIFKRFSGVAAHNRIYKFYRENVFNNYKYGKEIRIFDEQELIQNEFKEVQQANGCLIKSIGRDKGAYMSANSIVNTILSSIACLYIGLNAYYKVIGVGSVVKYSGAVTQLLIGISKITNGVASLKGNERFLRQYYEYLDLAMPKTGENPLAEMESMEFSFEHVYFRYPGMGDAWVLEDISFHVSQGEHLAVVGQNGSGKTTCIRLLLRLYRPDKGEILLNGVNIQEYDMKEYWKIFSVVFQDFKIFSVRLWQNIAGSGKKNEQEIMVALAKMGIDQMAMYDGVDSFLYKDYDEQGILISGGEAQKVAIAKALYKDAPFFVMDEPSAALDPIAEAQLYEKTNTLLKEKTMVFISHRLSSCCFCDRILVLKDGALLEEGSHEELLKLNGEYRRMWETQAKYYRH